MSISRPTLASIESLAIPVVQEVVFLADFRCAKCQQRVAEVMSKMNGETDSVVVSVLEKRVTVTCRLPTEADRGGASAPRSPVARLSKLAILLMRLSFSTCR
ncbi:uncharacterized protein LOC113753775 [Coffea eugenioides]|uniref:uncharacterized protein LOC113753775 n=1 Tax=Coffea eugenioides TaxID=49369 RepID=UPI000F60D735|nr:uncharacterized protein LOC113753775 [Coffea eugenioides]